MFYLVVVEEEVEESFVKSENGDEKVELFFQFWFLFWKYDKDMEEDRVFLFFGIIVQEVYGKISICDNFMVQIFILDLLNIV